MNKNAKIMGEHQSRNAYVYIRQSTEHQVRENVESQQRQYELKQLAERLGWNIENILVIDEDLGRSGSSAGGRTGFSKLVADVALNKAGIVLGLEVSRLARNNKDWYQLLDLCSLTNTLIADADGIYDPSLFNDRLLLGLKGTMSEAELHTIKSRMLQGMYHKAKKGELKFCLPVGYEFNEDDQIVKSKDEQVVHIIELIFKKFFELGSVNSVLLYIREEGLLFPRKASFDKKIRWVSPYYKAVYDSLNNPLYTGTYVFGRSKVEKTLDEAGNQKSRQKKQPIEKWEVIIHDHHPAYISWDEYLSIRKQIEANISPPRGEAGKVAREGCALLQGIVRCGICGRSMTITYHGQGSKARPRYVCNRAMGYGGKLCQGVGGHRIDKAMADLFLEVISPSTINVELKALDKIQQDKDLVLEQLNLQLERARYEADRMFRQYDAVEPENRLVVRTLEKQWDDALKTVAELEGKIAERNRSRKAKLSEAEKRQIKELTKDLPAIWGAPTTSDKDRKRLLRSCIKEVQIRKNGTKAELKILWKGGAISERVVPLIRARSSRATSFDVVVLVRQLATKYTDEQIARILSRKRLKTPTGLPYNARKVANLRLNYGIECYKKTESEDTETYTAQQAARLFRVSTATILNWVSLGMLKGEQMTSGAPWEIFITEDDKKKLMVEELPTGWLPIEPAAKELGVSKQTILNWVKQGKVDYRYVTKGRKKGLRINVKSTNCRAQARLFC